MSRVTLKMIAEKANTSIGTVDRALNNREGVNKDSKQLILKVAQELGYRPNKLASALGRKKTVKLAIIYPKQPQDFYCDIDLGIDKAVEELQDYGVVVEKIRYELQDHNMQNECLANIDLSQYDGLAINPSGSSSIPSLEPFIRQGLPVITFNNDSTEIERLFYVGANSRQSGAMGGEILSMMLCGQGNVIVFGNFAPFVERFGGFCEFIQPNFPDIRIFPCSDFNTDIQQASNSLINILENTKDVRGIFCTGYSSTVSAVNTLKSINRQDIRVVGYDLTNKTGELLNDGWCDALLYQDPYRQGHQAVHLLARHILEAWLPPKPRLYVDVRIIIKTNLNSYFNNFNQLSESHLEK